MIMKQGNYFSLPHYLFSKILTLKKQVKLLKCNKIIIRISAPYDNGRSKQSSLYTGKVQHGEVRSKLTELVSDKARSVNTSLNKVKAHRFLIISDAFHLNDSIQRLKLKNLSGFSTIETGGSTLVFWQLDAIEIGDMYTAWVSFCLSLHSPVQLIFLYIFEGIIIILILILFNPQTTVFHHFLTMA